jgi:hypothetical protein
MFEKITVLSEKSIREITRAFPGKKPSSQDTIKKQAGDEVPVLSEKSIREITRAFPGKKPSSQDIINKQKSNKPATTTSTQNPNKPLKTPKRTITQ